MGKNLRTDHTHSGLTLEDRGGITGLLTAALKQMKIRHRLTRMAMTYSNEEYDKEEENLLAKVSMSKVAMQQSPYSKREPRYNVLQLSVAVAACVTYT